MCTVDSSHVQTCFRRMTATRRGRPSARPDTSALPRVQHSVSARCALGSGRGAAALIGGRAGRSRLGAGFSIRLYGSLKILDRHRHPWGVFVDSRPQGRQRAEHHYDGRRRSAYHLDYVVSCHEEVTT